MNEELKSLLEFGILNIDKPSGPTSFNVSDFVRNALGLRKTSHFGTLDPKVTGVLPIALNRACKLTGYFIGHDKEYVGIMKIHEDVDLEKIKKVIEEKFLGKINQMPPVKSRVKRAERQREIKEFKILEKKEKEILFRVKCEGGTYIRKLIHDLGEELNIGAHMLELRRITAGIFSEKKSITLYDLEKAIEKKELEKVIFPAEEAIKKIYPVIEIKPTNLKQIFTGKNILKSDLVKNEKIKKGETISVFCENKFIGMYEVLGEQNFAKPKFVMQPIKQEF
jgi:H/ACA ribonucleoprotein complex subunit 4